MGDVREETARRARLHELDEVLDALERLNLEDARGLPTDLRDRLERIGVPVGGKPSFTTLIEQVWEMQEKFLNPGGPGEVRGQL
jgi:hypothetical protein